MRVFSALTARYLSLVTTGFSQIWKPQLYLFFFKLFICWFISQPGVRQWSMEICRLLHLLGLLFFVFKYFKGISVPAGHVVYFPNHLAHFKGECINHWRDFCGKCNSIYKVHWWCQLAVQIYCTAYHLQDFWTAHVY